MPRLLLYMLVLCTLAAAGCGTEPPAAASPTQPPSTQPLATVFEPATSGTIGGFVTWAGPVPNVPAVTCNVPRADGNGFDPRTLAQANTPHIDFATRGIEGAVVFLRNVDLARARPWDLPEVKVELRDAQIAVIQGNRTARTGFVRRGGTVTMQSVDPECHVLRVRGAAFYALPFPEPNQPLERTFDSCGRVELSSAAGFYWQAADLFVCDHPYYTLTEADGRFRFTSVPAGQYDLVVWHPNWVVTRSERNPESGQTSLQHYASPLENSRPVAVAPGRNTVANLTLPK